MLFQQLYFQLDVYRFYTCIFSVSVQCCCDQIRTMYTASWLSMYTVQWLIDVCVWIILSAGSMHCTITHPCVTCKDSYVFVQCTIICEYAYYTVYSDSHNYVYMSCSPWFFTCTSTVYNDLHCQIVCCVLYIHSVQWFTLSTSLLCFVQTFRLHSVVVNIIYSSVDDPEMRR